MPFQPLNDEDALRYVRDRVGHASEHPERRGLEREWAANQAYFAGQQLFVHGDQGMRFPQGRGSNDYYSANMVLVKTMRSVSRLLAINPKLEVVPDGADFLSRQAAKIGTSVYDHLQTTLNWQVRKLQHLIGAAIFGSSFLKVTWDPFAGEMNRIYLDKKGSTTRSLDALVDHQLRQRLEREGAYEDAYPGDIRLDLPTPYQMWWDPNCRTDPSSCNWMNQRTYRYIDDVRDEYREALTDRYGAKGLSMVCSSEDDSGAEYLEKQIAFMAQRLDGGFQVSVQPRSLTGARVAVDEFWEVPLARNGWYGRRIVIAGDAILKNDLNDYASAGMPIPVVKQDWFYFPGRFIGLSLVGQLRGPQRAYNESRSFIRRFARNNGHAPIFLQKGSDVKAKNLRGFPGVVYEINMNMSPPVFGQTPHVPDSVITDQETARREMDEIASQSEPTASLPGSLRSGAAVQQVRAENNAVLTPTSELMTAAFTEAGSMMLKLVGLYYDEPRIMQVANADGTTQVRTFRGSDLRGQFKLRVNVDAKASPSQETEDKIMRMLESGAIDLSEPYNRVLVVEALHFKTADPIVGAILTQVADEERILFQMLTDESYLPPDPQPWMDPDFRVKVLEREMNTEAFETAPQLITSKVIDRWQKFTQIIQERIQQQIQMQMALQGVPSQPGQASKPRPRPQGAA